MADTEIWKNIPGYEGLYQVSNHNQVKSLARECGNQYSNKEIILRPVIKKGHYIVKLHNENGPKCFYIHTLVAKAFGIWKEGCEIHHIDGNPLNNEPSNLEAINKEEHILKHSRKIEQLTMEGEYIQTFNTLELAERATTNAHRYNISACCSGRRKSAGGFKWRYSS